MKQGTLNFKFSHNRDFFVSPKNSIAFNLIKVGQIGMFRWRIFMVQKNVVKH